MLLLFYLYLRHQPSDPELQELGNVVEDRAQGDRDNVAFPHRHSVTELNTIQIDNAIGIDLVLLSSRGPSLQIKKETDLNRNYKIFLD